MATNYAQKLAEAKANQEARIAAIKAEALISPVVSKYAARWEAQHQAREDMRNDNMWSTLVEKFEDALTHKLVCQFSYYIGGMVKTYTGAPVALDGYRAFFKLVGQDGPTQFDCRLIQELVVTTCQDELLEGPVAKWWVCSLEDEHRFVQLNGRSTICCSATTAARHNVKRLIVA